DGGVDDGPGARAEHLAAPARPRRPVPLRVRRAVRPRRPAPRAVRREGQARARLRGDDDPRRDARRGRAVGGRRDRPRAHLNGAPGAYSVAPLVAIAGSTTVRSAPGPGSPTPRRGRAERAATARQPARQTDAASAPA